jgi:hypothetical protein
MSGRAWSVGLAHIVAEAEGLAHFHVVPRDPARRVDSGTIDRVATEVENALVLPGAR